MSDREQVKALLSDGVGCVCVTDMSDREQVKALVSELKVLIHIGRHLNILNVLGAITKDINSGRDTSSITTSRPIYRNDMTNKSCVRLHKQRV